MNRRLLYFISGFIVVGIFVFVIIFVGKDKSPKISVQPSSVETLKDTDRDGVQDWLEILNETDPFDPKDFPYKNNLSTLIEEDVNPNTLPTEFVIETISRLKNDVLGIEKVTPREKDRFLKDSSDFFFKTS